MLRRLVVGVGFQAAGESRLKALDERVNKFSRNVQRLNKDLNRIGKNLTLRVSAPLIAMGTGFVWAASNAEEMQSKFDVVFRGMEDSMRDWADESAKQWNRSSLDMQSYLADTQNMLVGMGMARDAGAEFSKEIVQMGVDLASFNNLAESDAISSLHSSLTGVHTAARSLGAVLNENTLALAMQEMGLKGTFQQLDENRKMQVRFRAIVMQSEDAIGDAVRTSDSFANQMRGLQGNVKDLSAEFGMLLIPTVTEYVQKLNGAVQWVRGLDDGTTDLIVRLGLFAIALGPAIWFVSKLITLGKGIGAVWTFINTKALVPAAGFLAGLAGKSKIAAIGLGILKGGALAVAGKIILLAPIFQDLYYAITGAGDSFLDSEGIIRDFIKTALGLNMLNDAWDWLKSVPQKIDDFKAKITGWSIIDGKMVRNAEILFKDFLFEVQTGIFNFVSEGKQQLDELVDWFKGFPGRAVDGMKSLGPRLKQSFSNALQYARDLLPFSPVKDRTSPFADLDKAGYNIIGNIQDGMKAAARSFVDAFPSVIPTNAGTAHDGPTRSERPGEMPLAPVVVSGGGGNFSPNIHITVNGGSGNPRETGQSVRRELEKALPRMMDEFFRMVARKRPKVIEY